MQNFGKSEFWESGVLRKQNFAKKFNFLYFDKKFKNLHIQKILAHKTNFLNL